ncbi:ABC transporter substrate-binding protein [Fodinicurvata sediminis]|uniref:ABC transporter substrate-binding protein n=1 Tax=Fodinicurvata sediminis TaxID=1121832 RepID=UPI0003FEE9E1|nr:ABC transporter substrate-binding protein [Fodinicurvata sediminis]
MKRLLLSAVASLTMTLAASSAAFSEEPIRLGDLNSYTGYAAFTHPYRDGWQMALEEVNEDGGVLGRQLRVVSRDDGASPADAITVANELVSREGAEFLFGTLLSHVGLAVSDFARQKEVLFLAAEPLTDNLVWDAGHDYTFRLRPGTYVQAAMLAEEAAKLDAKRWATVAPNYEYGRSAVEAFKGRLEELDPDVEFIAEQWPPQAQIDAGSVVQALEEAKPDAIFNVTFGGDLARFVREGEVRGLFQGRTVVSMLSGEPEWIDPLGEDAPEDWIVTGYPWYAIDTPEHNAFLEAYQERFDDYPRLGSVVGYVALHSLAKAIEIAETTDTEAVIKAMRGMEIETPLGPITYRDIDQQSDMGTFVGRLTVEDGKPRMVDWRYGSGADYLPSDKTVRELRGEED